MYLNALDAIENKPGSADKIIKSNATRIFDIYNGIAILYGLLGQYENALEYSHKNLELIQSVFGNNHPEYANCAGNLAVIYSDVGQYNNALRYLLEEVKIIEETLGKTHPSYGNSLSNLAMLYAEMDNYGKALPLLSEALENTENTLGKDHPSYGTRLNNLAGIYEHLGQYDKAAHLYLEALDNAEKTLGKNHPSYGTRLNNLALLYQKTGQYDKALPLYLESLENTQNTLGKGNIEYGTTLSNLATFYAETGKSDKALPLLIESLKINEQVLGKDHLNYSIILNNLAVAYQKTQQYEKALPLQLQSIEYIKKIFGEEHIQYDIQLSNLATLYWLMEKPDNSFIQFRQANQNQLAYLHKTYNLLSEQEKANFNQIILGNFTAFHGFTYHARQEVPEAMEEDLLVALATSGLLLNSSKQMREAVRLSGDTALQNLYDNWMLVNKQVDLAASLTIDERKNRSLDLAALQSKANDIERELVQKSAGLVDIPDYTIGKAQVSSALRKGEAAVQFNSFAYRNPKAWTDSVLYVAYIITPGGGLQYLPLFEDRQLLPLVKSLADSSGKPIVGRQTLEQLHDLVWRPLLPYLQEVSTVYYAPSGLLNKVPFAAVSSAGKETPGNAPELRCMFSVRDLPALKEKETPVAAGGLLALFGGANFDYPEKPANEQNFMYAPLVFGIADSLRGSSWGYLKGSLEEVKQINAIAVRSGLKTVLYTGTEASEAHLVSVTKEKKPAILHIATHGYYVQPPKRKPQADLAFAMIGDAQPIRSAENPLLRSGLLLAGANQKWQYNKNTDADNDGILTAQEISRMDLSNTQLVVLSACETGLGDIRHSEGVYGMQRAFRMAGAKKMIVSLWQVSDQAAAEMMELFYTALLQKKQSADQAFRYAQNVMRQKNPDKPQDWAGFVLVE